MPKSRTVLGLQRESGGEVRLDGKLVSGLPPKRARVVRNDIHMCTKTSPRRSIRGGALAARLKKGS